MLNSEEMRALEILVAVAVLSAASPAAAQSALIVRSGGTTSTPIEAAIDAALREDSRGSLRRIDTSLEDLALASGCAQPHTQDACLGRLAMAANIEELWIQHLSRAAAGWRIQLEVRGRDGARVWSIDVPCEEPTACAALLATRLRDRRGTGAADATPSEAFGTRSGRVRSERARAPEPLHLASTRTSRERRTDDVLPPVLFASGSVVGSGAIVAGVLAITLAGQEAPGDGRRGREAAPMSSGDVAVGVGATLGTLAVALVFAGGVCLALPQGSRTLALTRDGVALAF